MRCDDTGPPPLTAVIVGAGFGGIGMAIRLRAAGITDFVLLERGERPGGTWRDNTYPGAACDVPSALYSFSFEQDFDWPRFYSGQADIQRYLQHCADKHGVTPHVRTNTEVRRAVFDEAACLWRIDTASGDVLLARALITATGQLNRPALPKIDGLERFQGKVFHSARWDHAHALAGRRVGVIGTGASAIQLVAHVAAQAAHMTLFQRSAPYVMPKPDRRITRVEHWLHRKVPALRRLVRGTIYGIFEMLGVGLLKFPLLIAPMKVACLLHLRLAVRDPALRARLTPDYAFGCKRILFDNTYYPALARPNVVVETHGIRAIGEDHVLTDDGARHEVDTLIFATGFAASGFLFPMEIRGRGNRELGVAWREGAEAYLGISVHGFPNLFMLYGPNTNLGHNSIIYMLESQIRYVGDAIGQLRRAPGLSFDVRPEVQDAFNEALQHALGRTVWASGCSSWYLAANGKNTNNWSGFTFSYRRLTRRFDAAAYEAVPASVEEVA
jgi:cation diffusion facilitator CzcD-associated flavoprotein CzcO